MQTSSTGQGWGLRLFVLLSSQLVLMLPSLGHTTWSSKLDPCISPTDNVHFSFLHGGFGAPSTFESCLEARGLPL